MTTILNETQAAEILSRLVSEEVDATGVAADGKVIFEGQIIDRAEAARIHDERVISGRKAALFDVQDAIQDHLECGTARQRVRNNILFGLRFRIVNAARNVFYGMNAEAREAGHIDNFNEFLCALDEAETSADYAEQLGYAEYGTGMRKIKALCSIYDQWRRAAHADAESLGMTKYTAPSLHDGVHEVRTQDRDALAKALMMPRLEMNETYGQQAMDKIHNAVLMGQPCPAGHDAGAFEAYQQIYTMTVAKLKEDHEQQIKQDKNVAPYLERIIDEATRVPESVEFHQLDLPTQQALIEAVERAVAKVPEQLTKDRRVSITEMQMSCVALRRLRTKLADVLADPRFEV